MKISKLFHWLYASLMLLPIMVFGVTGLYYGLNQNAQLSERTEQTPVYYQSNELTSVSDFAIGNIYKYNNNYQQSNIGNENKIVLIDMDLFKYQFPQFDNYNLDEVSFYYVPNNSLRLLIYYFDTNNNRTNTQLAISNSTFNFIPISVYNQNYLENVLMNYITESDMLWIKTYETTTTTNDISTSIINAWNSTWQNPLFSWTNYSPFYAPMQSFTNVFGINDMQIANVLTYLATITAIYIVFDIVIELFTYLTHLIPRSD